LIGESKPLDKVRNVIVSNVSNANMQLQKSYGLTKTH
jgi:hypothetical protein